MSAPEGTYRAPGNCPTCGKVFSHATYSQGEGQHDPQPGDYTICAGCAAVLEWDADMILQATPADRIPAELAELRARVRTRTALPLPKGWS